MTIGCIDQEDAVAFLSTTPGLICSHVPPAGMLWCWFCCHYLIVFANYLHFFIAHIGSGNLAHYFISAFLMLICINWPEGAWVDLLLHCVKDILCVYRWWYLLYGCSYILTKECVSTSGMQRWVSEPNLSFF